MQLSNIISLLSLAGVALAECHRSGETWGDRVGEMQGQLRERLCTSGAMAGSFSQDQAKYGCVALKDGVHANFEIRRKGGATTLSDGDCFMYLNREVEGCEQGGWREYNNWIFR